MPQIRLRIIPESLFWFIPLTLGAELIALVAVLNKLSAFYALGALFTGHHLTVMEWVVNLITVATLPLFVFGYMAVHQRRPLGALVYAHLYAADVIVSLGFIIYFIIHWFAVGVKQANDINIPGAYVSNTTATASAAVAATGYATVPALASVTSSIPTASAKASQAVHFVLRSAVEDAKHLNKGAKLGQELAVTIVMTVFIILTRFYFMLVIFGFARQMVQRGNLQRFNGEPSDSYTALVQRLLLTPFEGFWTSSYNYTPVGANKLEADDFEIED